MTRFRPLRAALAGGALAFVVATVATLVVRANSAYSPSVRQPIAFNHRKHVEEVGLACSTCHEYYEKEAFSGLPTADACGACHSEPQGKTAEEAALVKLLASGAPLDWKPLFRQPPHVFYSHRRHVVSGKIECGVCHGTIAKSTVPPSSVKRLQMQDCIDCHERRGVSTACTTCHR
jgi:hypothetical protein